ncbi:hypothetical protein VH571_12635 [Frondihabitans sp. 4ASC-45]|uniref:hypothetical protein n=1 Tax=Frondihabitans sp. 4ASC-45 TaxID=3111636 RepID=UPI003C16AE08
MTVRVASRGLRVARGLIVATLSVAIAAFSHVAGGGMVPGLLGTVLALVFACLVCIALSARALAVVPLAVSVGVSQIVFHLLFSLGTSLPASAGDGHSVGMLGMVMSGGSTVRLPDVAGSASHGMEGMSDTRMWLGHAVAALLTIALLLHGERALVTIARLAVARLALVSRILGFALFPDRHGLVRALADRRGIRRLGVLLAARPHRGPPAVV